MKFITDFTAFPDRYCKASSPYHVFSSATTAMTATTTGSSSDVIACAHYSSLCAERERRVVGRVAAVDCVVCALRLRCERLE